MRCEIIHDLLPSYIDEICSEQSKKEVAKHLETCKDCNKLLNDMNQEIEIPNKEDIVKATKPFKKIKREKILYVLVAILTTVIVIIASYMVVQNVSVVHDFFFPRILHVIAPSDQENPTGWSQITFSEFDGTHTSEYLELNNIFFDGTITCNANSDGMVTLRIKDLDGEILIDNIQIEPGTSYETQGLKKFTEYILEVENSSNHVVINIS